MTSWDGHPESVCIDDDLVVSLSTDKTVRVHNLNTEALAQTIPLPHSMLEPSTLAISRPGFFAPVNQRRQTLHRKSITIPSSSAPLAHPPAPISKDPSEPTGSGLTPPPTPMTAKPPSTVTKQAPANFPRSQILIIGMESIYALLPSTLISQADGLLDSGRLEDTKSLISQAQRKILASLGPENEFVSLVHTMLKQCLSNSRPMIFDTSIKE